MKKEVSRSFMSRLSIQVVFLAIIPILLLSFFTVSVVQKINSVNQTSQKEQLKLINSHADIVSYIASIRESSTLLAEQLAQLVQANQTMLLVNEPNVADEVNQYRNDVDTTISNTKHIILGLPAELVSKGVMIRYQEGEINPEELSEQDLKEYEDNQALVKENKRLAIYTKKLERQFKHFKTVNDNTLALMKGNRKKASAENFIYEGRSKVEALSKTMIKITRALEKVSNLTVVILERQEKQLEELLNAEVAQETTSAYVLLSVSVFVIVTVSILFAYRRIAKPLSSLTETMQKASAGDTNVTIDVKDRKDEFGEMGRALEVFVSMYTLNAEMVKENLRIRNALNSASSPVSVADNEHNIIFNNEAALALFKNKKSDVLHAISRFDDEKLNAYKLHDLDEHPKVRLKNLQELKASNTDEVLWGGMTLRRTYTPIEDDEGRVGTIVEWYDRTDEMNRLALESERNEKEKAAIIEERKMAKENNRIKQALDSSGNCAMIADENFNIIYMNAAMQKTFERKQQEIREALPSFNASDLLGANMDAFHKNPSHQRNIVSSITNSYKTVIPLGSLTFEINANPIYSEDSQHIGTVLQWVDRTEEIAIEKEIDSIVEAAANGDFTQSLSLKGKEGFFHKLSVGLNEIMETASSALNDINYVLARFSQGDLTDRIVRDYKGSYYQLKQNSNSTADKLTEVINGISQSANSVVLASQGISQGNIDLKERTEAQSESLVRTSESMTSMTNIINSNAESAVTANNYSSDAVDIAEQGGEVVQRAIQSMQEINKSSKKIADISSVIDSIAFQTNLLALNAAVEAARAGEQGRGFAVVAGEVRNLAQRSASAAKEIKGLIDDSVKKISDGSKLVNESGETLHQIVEAIEKVSDIIQSMNASAEAQISGVEQVNDAIGQMQNIIHQNTALVEESSNASQAMESQALQMNNMIGFFKVKKD